MEPTPEQAADVLRLKRWKPYRVVFGAMSPEGEWRVYAKNDRRIMLALARQGWAIYQPASEGED